MSSRREEKEARRQERLEREAAEERAAARRKRLGMAGAVLAGLGAIAAVVAIAVTTLGGGDEETTAGGASDAAAAVQLPEQRTSDLQEAAKAAGCEIENAKYEGAGHEEKEFKPSDYKTNPPTSGMHFPEWYDDGIYTPGTVPELGQLVHTLEHGRINLQYAKGTPAGDVAKLEALYQEQNEGYHILLYENATDMPSAVAATAWTQKIGCPEMNDEVFDALRTFRARYTDKGPETVP